MNKTTIFVKKEQALKDRKVYLFDATGKTLGRFASEIAKILRGKHKPNYTPHVDCGDNVIVINVEKVRLTGKKWTNRKFFSHSGYPGGQKITSPEDMFKKDPARLFEKSVKGMLPKNRLGNAIYKNLYLYTGPEHPHQAQKPKEINLNSIK